MFQINNPDKRVVIIKEFALANFPSNDILHFALNVEKVTTSKVSVKYDYCLYEKWTSWQLGKLFYIEQVLLIVIVTFEVEC